MPGSCKNLPVGQVPVQTNTAEPLGHELELDDLARTVAGEGYCRGADCLKAQIPRSHPASAFQMT